MGPGTILVGAMVSFAVVLISKSIRVVQQAQTIIIERLGKYHKTLGSGINFVLPVIDRPRAVDWHQTIITPAGDSYSRRFRTERIDLRERSEEHTSELQSRPHLVCRLLLEKKKKKLLTPRPDGRDVINLL